MAERINIAEIEPKAYQAMLGLEKYISSSSLDKSLQELIKIRVSQINGCAFCIDMHTRSARNAGESERRIYALNAWRDTDFFSDRERAALALSEAVTLITKNHVPDHLFDDVRKHYSEKETAELIMAIVTINSWNRIAISSGKMPVD